MPHIQNQEICQSPKSTAPDRGSITASQCWSADLSFGSKLWQPALEPNSALSFATPFSANDSNRCQQQSGSLPAQATELLNHNEKAYIVIGPGGKPEQVTSQALTPNFIVEANGNLVATGAPRNPNETVVEVDPCSILHRQTDREPVTFNRLMQDLNAGSVPPPNSVVDWSGYGNHGTGGGGKPPIDCGTGSGNGSGNGSSTGDCGAPPSAPLTNQSPFSDLPPQEQNVLCELLQDLERLFF